MRKIIVICFMWLVVQPTYSIANEWPKIKSDSLLKLFKMMEPFEVLDKIYVGYIDVKDCYYNEEVKPYLLKWLDKEAYFEYLNKDYIKLAFINDRECSISKIKGWLNQHNQGHLIDTVMKTPELFKVYLDSVIDDVTKYKRKSFFQNGGRLPGQAIYFHALLKLPESYEILRRYWKEDGGKINSKYFDAMLAMHDPEAISKYNSYLDSAIKNVDLSPLYDARKKTYNVYVYGSYALELRLKLLRVTHKSWYSLVNYFYCPYNISLLYLPVYEDTCFRFSNNDFVLRIIDSAENMEYEPYEELEKWSMEVVENIKEFEKAAEPCIKQLMEEELYWKKNMPYYKNEENQ